MNRNLTASGSHSSSDENEPVEYGPPINASSTTSSSVLSRATLSISSCGMSSVRNSRWNEPHSTASVPRPGGSPVLPLHRLIRRPHPKILRKGAMSSRVLGSHNEQTPFEKRNNDD
jgi:hypothetical protein